MSDDLEIEFDWLNVDTGNEIDRVFAASIGISVGGEYVTQLDDLGAKTVRNQLRASAWHLAAWFAANWWRLRWEPAHPGWAENPEWRLAHSIAAVGGGFIWPDAIFASDGEFVEIVSNGKRDCPKFEPIRYINNVWGRISADEFERKIDQFMMSVLSRLESFRVTDRVLADLWKEVQSERRNLKARKRRKLEAMAGYDPDEAPDELIKELIQDKEHLGKNALEEVAAEARHQTPQVLNFLRDASRARAGIGRPRFTGVLPEIPEANEFAGRDAAPWQRAKSLARLARERWGLGKKPIRNKDLAGLVGATSAIFTEKVDGKAPIAFALQSKTNGHHELYFDSSVSTTRRFAVSRIIGDHLASRYGERLLPATDAKTYRQRFQRAFAQELLCPIDALLEKIQTPTPKVNDIEAAADHFHVSPLLVRTTLVNNREVGREALTRED